MERFSFPSEVNRPREEDFYGQPGYRFWIPTRDGKPICAIEQTSATVWFRNSAASIDLMTLYRASHKEVPIVAAAVLAESQDRK